MSAVDLYQDDFSRLSDAAILQAVEAFTRIAEPPEHRPREGFVLDFKEIWNEGALHTVAGFAHAFGGLLIVGVSDSGGLPDKIVGVESCGELKTTIASSIATNISPTPRYEIAECSLRSAGSQRPRKLAVVRVQQGNQLYYFTKKGERPIYIRNEDQSVPADAAQLRSLIERRTDVPGHKESVRNRIGDLRASVQLRYSTPPGTPGIPTHLQILLVPFDHPGLPLDSALEKRFRRVVCNLFNTRHGKTSFKTEDEREAGWYEHRWLCSADGHESVWRLTSEGDIGYATQARVRLENKSRSELGWSLGDTIADLLLMLAAARSVWKASGFYGEAQLLVGLNVQELPLHPYLTTEIWSSLQSPQMFRAMHDYNAALEQSVFPASKQSSTATATGVFNSGLPYDADAVMVASVMNQLLRSLKHTADLSMLRRAVEQFFHYASIERAAEGLG